MCMRIWPHHTYPLKRARARTAGQDEEAAQLFGRTRVDGDDVWPEGLAGAAPETMRQYAQFLLDKKQDEAGADKVWTDVVGGAEEEREGALARLAPKQRHDLLLEYAKYLSDDRQRPAQAADMCRDAIKAFPKDPTSITMYASLLQHHHKDFALADKYFRQAILRGSGRAVAGSRRARPYSRRAIAGSRRAIACTSTSDRPF